MVGEYLISIKRVSETQMLVTTDKNKYALVPQGDWMHEAWIHSYPEEYKQSTGLITKVNDSGYCYSIITENGYNDIELRVEYGYEGEFNVTKMSNDILIWQWGKDDSYEEI